MNYKQTTWLHWTLLILADGVDASFKAGVGSLFITSGRVALVERRRRRKNIHNEDNKRNCRLFLQLQE
jgi:hypothetical protein